MRYPAAPERGRVMRRSITFVVGPLIGLFASGVVVVAQTPGPSPSAPPGSFPAWAYPWAPDFKAPPDDGVPRHVPDSTAAFTITQERDLFFAPDWHPEDHPPMPGIRRPRDRPPKGAARRFLSSHGGNRGTGERKSGRSSCLLHRSADGRLQKRRAKILRPAEKPGPVDERNSQSRHR